MKRLGLIAVVALTGCATAQPRFKDQPIVWAVDDTRDVPVAPEDDPYRPFLYLSEILVIERSSRALRLDDLEPARSTNALDEAPDSTWFTNRIGVRDVSPAEAAQGASVTGRPQLPLEIVSGKSGGGNPGFVAKDRTGRRFLIKFDTKENPEMQTATDVIVSRIFWAGGYPVPADHVLVFARGDVTIGSGAKVKAASGAKRLMTDDDVAAILASSPKRADGRYRALASEFLKGKPIGGYRPSGVRADDPNDTIPHEHRRAVRGLRVFASWTNHTDMKLDNTLDMYVEEDGRHFVRHYLVDFGEAFGSHAAEKGRFEDGFEHVWDWQAQPLAMLALGLWKRPWEGLENTRWPSVGAFESEIYEPDGYRSAYPWWPFFAADAADHYWGAKIVMRFTRPILEAIVAEARLTDPTAAAYLVDTLLARQAKIGKAWLDGVTALDHFEVDADQLCAIDLAVHHGVVGTSSIERLDDDGELVDERAAGEGARVCFPIAAGDAYQVFRLRARRGAERRPVMQVHFKGGPAARILGVIRVEHANTRPN